MIILNIGLIDADLLDGGTKHPNLALEKISGFYKEQNNFVNLITNYNEINNYDKVFLSKVFDYTKIPINISHYPQIEYGGTGFYKNKI